MNSIKPDKVPVTIDFGTAFAGTFYVVLSLLLLSPLFLFAGFVLSVIAAVFGVALFR
jgi:hypothetical protein